MIKSALTAEEWREKLIPNLGIALHPDGLHVPLWTNDNSIPVLDSSERHKVAALALYQQSFGFTRADAEKLRSIARTNYDPEGGDDWDNDLPALWSLALRIEALLPPE